MMLALYALDLNSMEYCLLCNGSGMRFGLDGHYKRTCKSIAKSATPVDIVSVLQQGNACEVAVLSGTSFMKRQVDLNRVLNWINLCPARHKAALTVKRKVASVVCLQTIYVYNHNSIQPFLTDLL